MEPLLKQLESTLINKHPLPGYDDGGRLSAVDVKLRGAGTATSFVTDITYNERGQRDKIIYGNGSQTRYIYDVKTFRLTRLLTTKNTGADILQDLNYTYDPVGNIVEQIDNAQQTLYFDNTEVSPNGKYEYDALYRLIEAEGRELIGLNAPGNADININTLPENTTAMRLYTESYEYDELGNIEKMIHAATGGNWTRHYHYNAGFTNNLLLSNSTDGIQPADQYTYDAHGNMTKMSHLSSMTWVPIAIGNADRLQSADLGGGGDVYYTYDAGGNRVRKVADKGGGLIHERIYLGDWEVYREIQSSTVQLERETLHISDDTGRIALVDTKTVDGGSPVGSPVSEMRYQLSNHLGSATLELDDVAAIISYEEYHPFGTTSYRSGRNAAETSLKRYRYVGKERDDETGLYYYGARYYAAWLARFISTDPLKDEYPYYTSYQYAGNKPVTFIDLDGLEEAIPKLLMTPALKELQKSAFKKPATYDLSKQGEIKSDKTQVNSLNEIKAFIQGQVDKKQAFEQFKSDLANNKTSFQAAPIKEVVQPTSLRHPGVDQQSFQMATQDPFFQASAVSLFAAGTVAAVEATGAAQAAKPFVERFLVDASAQLLSDSIRTFQDTGKVTFDLGDIDIANAFFKSVLGGKVGKNNPELKILEEALKTFVDLDIDDGLAIKNLETQTNEILTEFGLRLVFTAIPGGKTKDGLGNTVKDPIKEFTVDVIKKTGRNETRDLLLDEK
ncbi:MAG: RHS repeat-associated core domain-containing protein [Cyclobacteriaceae bacterium]